jgi:hypothetical protein
MIALVDLPNLLAVQIFGADAANPKTKAAAAA